MVVLPYSRNFIIHLREVPDGTGGTISMVITIIRLWITVTIHHIAV
jgi:hypothetical protein